MKLPPYTIPKADADLHGINLSPTELENMRPVVEDWNRRVEKARLDSLRKTCPKCGHIFGPYAMLACPRCRSLRARLQGRTRRAIDVAPRIGIQLTEDQLRRLDKVIRDGLPKWARLVKELDPADGVRLGGYPYVGIQRIFVKFQPGTSKRDADWCRQVLRGSIVEIHEGAAWEWIMAQCPLPALP